MKRLIYVVGATALLSITLSACGGSDSELENNVGMVDNSNNNVNGNVESGNNSDNSGMNGNNNVNLIDMSPEELAELQVTRFVEMVNRVAGQTTEDDVLVVMINLTAEIRASDPAQAEVNFEGDVFTTAQGIKYKLLIGKDKVEVGEVVR